MLSKLEMVKMMRKVGDYYNCSSVAVGGCDKCPFNVNVVLNLPNPICISNARKYLIQHEKKLHQWKNLNAK